MVEVRNQLLEELKDLNGFIDKVGEARLPWEFKVKMLSLIKKEIKDIEVYLKSL